MKLYALLIGITDYPISPLLQCVNDVNKVEAYLNKLPKTDLELQIKKLTNNDATKPKIIHAIHTFIGQAQDGDVAMIYYSGHGAHEIAEGLFMDEQDGMIECLVAHFQEEQKDGFLLADKEIRYILSTLPNNPHLVTVFDCCHSGDIVRDFSIATKPKQIKRIVTPFPPRKYEDFIFAENISQKQLSISPIHTLIGFKNHVHIAACTSEESSWEGPDGGFFTKYLLRLLKATNNQITYNDITKWAKISLRDVTEEKQTPTISVQGKGKVDTDSSWLNLHPDHPYSETLNLVHNNQKGWYLTGGKILGIKDGASFQIQQDGENITLSVTNADLEFANVEDPIEHGYILDYQSRYPTTFLTHYGQVQLFINNIDNANNDQTEIEQLITGLPEINITGAYAADYWVNLFNECVYISNPQCPYQPLAIQIDRINPTQKWLKMLKRQLRHLIKWHHFDTLNNPDSNFGASPIKFEIKYYQTNEWIDVTNRTHQVPLNGELTQKANQWTQAYQAKVTNISDETIFVAVLVMNADFSIEASPWQKQVIKLEPGQFKFFYDHKSSLYSGIKSECYKDLYNWRLDWLHYKFIINNYDDFTTSINDFLQPGLDHPIVSSDPNRHQKLRAGFALSDLEEVTRKWMTLKTTIQLPNPFPNSTKGYLEQNLEHLKSDEIVGPFLSQLYFNRPKTGLNQNLVTKPNNIQLAFQEKSFIPFELQVRIGNQWDHYWRLRRFKKTKKLLPGLPTIVAEGDSWFLYPIYVKDILDHLMDHYPVLSLAAATDELGNYKKEGQLLDEVDRHKPTIVLISGGGNDIIGPEIQHLINEGLPSGLKPTAYLNQRFTEALAELKALYEYFIMELKAPERRFVKQLFVHGYDYIRVDHSKEIVDKGWVNKHLIAKGIHDANDRKRIIEYLIDTFNEMLHSLCEHDDFVTYINARGKVLKGQWADEIHPDDNGFKTIADLFIQSIRQHT